NVAWSAVSHAPFAGVLRSAPDGGARRICAGSGGMPKKEKSRTAPFMNQTQRMRHPRFALSQRAPHPPPTPCQIKKGAPLAKSEERTHPCKNCKGRPP